MRYWRIESIPELAGLNWLQRKRLYREIPFPGVHHKLFVLVPAFVNATGTAVIFLRPHFALFIVPPVLVFLTLWLLIWPPIAISRMRPAIRRVLEGHFKCHNCGYDLYGFKDRCPECGTEPSNEQKELIEIAKKRAQADEACETQKK